MFLVFLRIFHLIVRVASLIRMFELLVHLHWRVITVIGHFEVSFHHSTNLIDVSLFDRLSVCELFRLALKFAYILNLACLELHRSIRLSTFRQAHRKPHLGIIDVCKFRQCRTTDSATIFLFGPIAATVQLNPCKRAPFEERILCLERV